MANSKLFGKATLKVNGKALRSKAGASLDIGGVARNTQSWSGGRGFTEEDVPSKLEAEFVFGEGDTIADFEAVDAVAEFKCDTGQTYVIPRCWRTTTPVLTDGGGGVKLTLEGDPAEEML